MKPLKELRSEKSQNFIKSTESILDASDKAHIHSYESGWDACLESLAECKELDEDDFCEQQVLELSTNGTVDNLYAADFRIGFRYGFRRTTKRANLIISALRLRIAELEGEK